MRKQKKYILAGHSFAEDTRSLETIALYAIPIPHLILIEPVTRAHVVFRCMFVGVMKILNFFFIKWIMILKINFKR